MANDVKILDLDTHDEPVVTVAELAAYWRVSPRTIYRHIDKGALEVRRLPGGDIRIPIDAARRYGDPSDTSA